ncbi:hypothetical protein [Duganella sp. LjRoot269]|jgi:hypothetical protein|uniref:hypothetical protein n=1 Tax=Duganella sp. LjRoot269 TaxID=3342305 RepID=UPI003ECEA033
MKKLLIFCSLMVLFKSALAQFANADGAYVSNDVHLQVIVLETDKGTVAASTSVTRGACAGEIAGLGKITEKKMVFSPYAKEPGGEACLVTVEFDAKFQRGRIFANESCTIYHGASCSWEGQTISKEKPKK